MDFRTIFQLRNKKVWWMDVIFYFIMALLAATVICYLVFLVKNIIQKRQIEAVEQALTTVGTDDQKKEEAEVILYKLKLTDFGNLVRNHGFASNIFYFMQDNTQPKVWFSQFNLDARAAEIQVSGKADDMDMLARQTSTFERNEYVSRLGNFNSTLADDGKISFNFALAMDKKIFSYTVAKANQKIQEEKKNVVQVTGSITQTEGEQPPEQQGQTAPAEGAEGTGTPVEKSSEKMIYAIDVVLPTGEIVGNIDHLNNTILFQFPFGTDITNLAATIIISDKARIFPESGVPQNFTNPFVYQVTAEDGTTQDYVVSAELVKTPEQIEAEKAKSKNMGLVIFLLVVAVITLAGIIALVVFLYLRKHKKKRPK